MKQIPPPGVDGTYRDSCVVCLGGTDTGLAFRGEAEFIMAGMIMLGVPEDEAGGTLADATGCDPGMVPGGVFDIAVRVCQSCADASKGKVTVAPLSGALPLYVQPDLD